VDVLFLHSRIVQDPGDKPDETTPAQALGPVLEAYQAFRREGRARWLGFTGLGDTPTILEVVDSGAFDVMQCYYNAINPSAAYEVPEDFDQQDLQRVMQRAARAGMGVLAIRILAAGALAESDERHPVAGPAGRPLMGGSAYALDQRRAEAIRPIARELGMGLDELGIRFALARPEVSTALVGVSSAEQLDVAVRAAEAGPLAADVCERIVAAARQAGTAAAA
jgi:L-galactose dehydrogenase/L-glyceraldehyde 3-phosphate reductase